MINNFYLHLDYPEQWKLWREKKLTFSHYHINLTFHFEKFIKKFIFSAQSWFRFTTFWMIACIHFSSSCFFSPEWPLNTCIIARAHCHRVDDWFNLNSHEINYSRKQKEMNFDEFYWRIVDINCYQVMKQINVKPTKNLFIHFGIHYAY